MECWAQHDSCLEYLTVCTAWPEPVWCRMSQARQVCTSPSAHDDNKRLRDQLTDWAQLIKFTHGLSVGTVPPVHHLYCATAAEQMITHESKDSDWAINICCWPACQAIALPCAQFGTKGPLHWVVLLMSHKHHPGTGAYLHARNMQFELICAWFYTTINQMNLFVNAKYAKDISHGSDFEHKHLKCVRTELRLMKHRVTFMTWYTFWSRTHSHTYWHNTTCCSSAGRGQNAIY